MPTFAQAVFGPGVVIPINLFNQKFPGIFRNTGEGWERTDKDLTNFGNLVIHYSEYEFGGPDDLFLTTNRAPVTSEFEPTKNIDLNNIMYGVPEFQNWVNQVFPQVAPTFSFTLYAFGKFE